MFEINKDSSKHEVYLAIAHGSADVLEKANPEFLKDREYIAMLVKGNPNVLRYADPSFRDDEEIVRLALTTGGYGLKFASERLRKDENFLISVAKKDFFILDAIEDEALKRSVTYSVLIDKNAKITELEGKVSALKRQLDSKADPEEIAIRDKKIETQNKLIANLNEIILSNENINNNKNLPVESKPISMAKKFRDKIANIWGTYGKNNQRVKQEEKEYDDEDMKIFNPRNSKRNNNEWEK
ncbi:MAG: DUF4116 domain-containing protein [Clostridia bacterium]|nr:DUF4116 domain-containing protein [Clostridia bacterium]MBP3800496.1 DUF4116 domain-containing protein [Clostridia bacterium]